MKAVVGVCREKNSGAVKLHYKSRLSVYQFLRNRLVHEFILALGFTIKLILTHFHNYTLKQLVLQKMANFWIEACKTYIVSAVCGGTKVQKKNKVGVSKKKLRNQRKH